jgi:hypothetical protein
MNAVKKWLALVLGLVVTVVNCALVLMYGEVFAVLVAVPV